MVGIATKVIEEPKQKRICRELGGSYVRERQFTTVLCKVESRRTGQQIYWMLQPP
jgi:hypothetical protein